MRETIREIKGRPASQKRASSLFRLASPPEGPLKRVLYRIDIYTPTLSNIGSKPNLALPLHLVLILLRHSSDMRRDVEDPRRV